MSNNGSLFQNVLGINDESPVNGVEGNKTKTEE